MLWPYLADKLIRAYYKRHPTARFLPIDLQSDEPNFVRAFALRQGPLHPP